MHKITCGRCARVKYKFGLEKRKELALGLKEGINECGCGRVLVIEGGRYSLDKSSKWLEDKQINKVRGRG